MGVGHGAGMSNDLETITPDDIERILGADRDPATLGYPPMLPVELALKEHGVKEICLAYKIDEDEWDRIRMDPVFQKDLAARMVELGTNGVDFKMKARLQSEAYLKKLWLITENKNRDGTPADYPVAVRADIMKFVIRAAGLDGSRDQAAAAIIGNALSINLHLG